MKEKKDLKKLIQDSWYKQAMRDLDVANLCISNGFYEWACFCYQEATVKVIKAAIKKLGLESFRHSIFSLLETLNERIHIPEELFEIAKEIDKHYIISRYPGANMLKPPYENYKIEDAQRVKNLSKQIIQFIEQQIIKN
ncbi:MAG: HEPN domain-containing protein [Candidatus Calescibacterium sp.]|nr:HEPN domain-containing protein [Candidatus Calescibacterium sp.]MCX7972053.1 HEPN domain-containing protein [bacterium]MDW8194663.1 HEPN domain-containing protein [Candidatus Calescibacterium sp.]